LCKNRDSLGEDDILLKNFLLVGLKLGVGLERGWASGYEACSERYRDCRSDWLKEKGFIGMGRRPINEKKHTRWEALDARGEDKRGPITPLPDGVPLLKSQRIPYRSQEKRIRLLQCGDDTEEKSEQPWVGLREGNTKKETKKYEVPPLTTREGENYPGRGDTGERSEKYLTRGESTRRTIRRLVMIKRSDKARLKKTKERGEREKGHDSPESNQELEGGEGRNGFRPWRGRRG